MTNFRCAEAIEPGFCILLTRAPHEALVAAGAAKTSCKIPVAVIRKFWSCAISGLWGLGRNALFYWTASFGEIVEATDAIHSSDPDGNTILEFIGEISVTLAGLIAGLFAQPALATDPLKTLRYAVWRHGASADKLTAQKPDWTVQELAAAL